MRLFLALIAGVCVSLPVFAADPDPEPGGKKLTAKELVAARKAVED